MVFKDDFERLCKAFREFPYNTSLPEQADAIERIAKDAHCHAICWNQTSVNADIPAANVNGKYWNLFDNLKPEAMKTKYKHSFERMYYMNRWSERPYSRPSNWVVIGIHTRWFSHEEYSWRISLLGLEWSFWFKRTLKNPQ